MPDKLNLSYQAWLDKVGGAPNNFQAFQAGFSASALSMRIRAMNCFDGETDLNKIKNKIGQLSDIPE